MKLLLFFTICFLIPLFCFGSESWISGQGSRGITQEWLAPTTNGTGGMHLSNATGNSYICPQSSNFGGQFSCLQHVTGTGGEVILGGVTHLYSGLGLGLNIANGNFSGTSIWSIDSQADIIFPGDVNNNYYNLWTGKSTGNVGFGQQINKTAVNVSPSSSATIMTWTPDSTISFITLHFVCGGGSSTASDYWFFDRNFQLNVTGISGTTHTGWTGVNGGATEVGKAVVADSVSAGLAGSTISMTFSGLTMTATINNASASLTGRITCDIDDHNGHTQ